jgi:beta-galactosidase
MLKPCDKFNSIHRGAVQSISRRDLISSGLAFSAACLATRPAWARAIAFHEGNMSGGEPEAGLALSPREQLLFDFGWKFVLGDGNDPVKDLGFGFGQSDFSRTGEFQFAKAGFDDSKWRSLDLPHDWAVELPFVHDDSGSGDSQLGTHGYKPLGRRYPETSVGWYRREFDVPASDRGRRTWIEFDGAFRDVYVFVNGCYIGNNENGYVPFRFDLTDFLSYGAKNFIVVRVDARYGDGWFYEGAGIYRHVWLMKQDALHLGRWESTVRSSLSGNAAALSLSTIVENEAKLAEEAYVSWQILDAAGNTVATVEAPAQKIDAEGTARFSASAHLSNPALWSVEEPNLYTAIVTVSVNGAVRDAERVTFGVRSVRFDAQKGFYLNGKSLKIQGTCNHQNHAGVGAALPDRLQYFRLGVLQQMGCNAVRTSHYMPTPEWVEACDRMGVMMMCETRQASSNPSGLAQLEAMIKRYRNSPSVIIWSVGNEENQLQGPMAEQGAAIAATMVRMCHELDPTRVVSAAVNADNRKGISDAVDLVGFNYHLDFPDAFHKDNPTRPIFGSETSSAVSTRGEYTTDRQRNVVDSYHGIWEPPELWWKFYGEREWTAGGFAWTGFDYRGEPKPFGWPSVSSNYGIVDLCGFPKDYFYYYKAWWRPEPALHLLPHWNWHGKEGSEIAVWVYSNLDEVELLVNGVSAGTQKVPHLGHLEWKVKYQPGVIEARGIKSGKVVLIEKRETTGPAATLRLTADRTEIFADGEDVAVLKVEALDSLDRLVPDAGDLIAFRVWGDGKLIGLGNGNPNCQESDKDSKRSLFHGLAQIIVQSTKNAGEMQIEAVSQGAEMQGSISARLTVKTKQARLRPSVPAAG